MNYAIDKFDPERLGRITGSVCGVLFPQKSAEVGQRSLAIQLARDMYFESYDEVTTWQMEHGHYAEHFAFLHFQSYLDKNIEHGGWVKKGNCGGTTDAIGLDYGVDFKCPTSRDGWLDYASEGISSDQFNQCQMYMYLTGFEKWLVGAYLIETQRMDDNGLKYPVPESQRMILVKVDKDPTWEEKLLSVVPKIIKMRDEHLEFLRNKFPKK